MIRCFFLFEEKSIILLRWFELKNKYIIILFIVIGIFISSLITIYALNKIQPGKTIEAIAIPLSFLNIFATGYGAYLGAKISGENATQLMKDQLIITELIQNSKNDYLFLKDFENIIDQKFSFNLNEKNKLDILFNYNKAFNLLNEIGHEDVSAIIKYPFDEFISLFKNVSTQLDNIEYNFVLHLNSYGKEQLFLKEDDFDKIIEDISFELAYTTYTEGRPLRIPYLVTSNKDYIEHKYIEINSEEYFHKLLIDFKVEIDDLIKLIDNLNLNYNKLQFKKNEDLKRYIFNFYSTIK